MKKYSKNQIISRLKIEGLRFSEFSLIHEGNYETDDADWNYKDVPHLHHVHELAEAIPTIVSDDIITSVNMQKVLWFRFPFSLTNFESGENAQTYYTTWMFYVLMIETVYEKTGPCQTRVTTTYAVGSPIWLHWTFPIIRWILKRNYDNLMSTDIPMRTRRGQLRGWGYTFFKEDSRYSFEKTMDILKSNVISPNLPVAHAGYNVSIAEVLPNDGEHFLGRDDHLGIRLVRQGNQLMFYPRMCPHEGASLDSYSCKAGKDPVKGGKLQCAWHGRVFKPFANFDISNAETQEIKTEFFIIKLDNNNLKIQMP
jgi:nitrite reductase/ring-hydroxylating ferredoxin subunit